MKSFITIVLAASATLTAAQYTSNPDGTFTCAIPNAAYCAGDSLSTNIIIRCIGTVGQPGNCNDNLDGEPPFGLSFAPCWQPSVTSGMAACSKNCIVYGGSGNYNGTFTLPNCTPTTTVTTASTSTVSTSTVISASGGGSVTFGATSTTTITIPCSSSTSVTVPSVTAPTTVIPIISGPTGGASVPVSNGTVSTSTVSVAGGSATAGSATATPVGPTTPVGATTTGAASFTGAAVANQAGAALAAGGLFMAFFF